MALSEHNLVHAVVVRGELFDWIAEGRSKRTRAIALRGVRWLPVGFAANNYNHHINARRRVAERFGVGHCPYRDTIVERTQEIERAQEVLEAAVRARVEAIGRGRGLSRVGQPTERNQRSRCIDMHNGWQRAAGG